MKKKLLFVIPSLSPGGGEKSLVNLISQINFMEYNVDLFLFNHSGMFANLLPSEVNILELPENYNIFTKKLSKALPELLIKGKIRLAISRVIFTLLNQMIKKQTAEQYTWKYQKDAFDTLDMQYDAAIGFMEKSSIYLVIDKVISKKKIGWIHTNYSDSGMNNKIDLPFFKRLNYIVTVSDECAKSLKENFDELKEKVQVIHNIVSPTIIRTLALQNDCDNPLKDKSSINILTIARLSSEKGIDLAIDACKILIQKGYNIKWFVLGEGGERTDLERKIISEKLGETFYLLGVHENPYSYLNEADVYVQPSRYEGRSIAIDEAKILGKPLVLTDYPTAVDQIDNGINGLIVSLNPIGIALGIEKIIKDIELKNNLVNNLSKEQLGTENEILKLYKLLN